MYSIRELTDKDIFLPPRLSLELEKQEGSSAEYADGGTGSKVKRHDSGSSHLLFSHP